MKSTNNSMNMFNTNYKTVIIPEESVNAVKQRLGNDFVWKQDEKTNQLYLMEKSKSNSVFLTELGKDMSEMASEWYNGELVNRWDD